MLLLAVGALVAGLTGCLGWGNGGGHDSCWHGGDEFLEHGHHVFHLFRILCLKHICYLGDDHSLSLVIREFFFRCLVCNAFSDGSGCRPVPLDLFGVFVDPQMEINSIRKRGFPIWEYSSLLAHFRTAITK